MAFGLSHHRHRSSKSTAVRSAASALATFVVYLRVDASDAADGNSSHASAAISLCKLGEFNTGTQALGCQKCRPGRVTNTSGGTECKSCAPGRYSIEVGLSACAKCPGTSYSSVPGQSTCVQCPPNGICESDANGLRTSVTNADGFYLIANGEGPTGELAPCLHGQGRACLARGLCWVDPGADASSGPAMEGPMCGQCAKGFGRKHALDLCSECKPVLELLAWGAFQLLTLAITTAAYSTSTILTDFTQPKSKLVIILKQFVAYVQMNRIVLSTVSWDKIPFNANLLLDDSIKNLDDVFNAGSSGDVPILTCLLQRIAPSVPIHVSLLVVGVLWLPMWLLAVFLFFGIGSVMVHRAGFSIRRPLIISIVVNVLVVFPAMTGWLVEVTECRPFDVPRLAWNPSVSCEGGADTLWWAIGYSCVLLLPFGIPVGVFFLLYNHHRRRSGVHDTLRFLYAGYDTDKYYWEAVIMVRKVFFAIIVLAPQVRAQEFDSVTVHRAIVASLLIVAIFFYALHQIHMPFDNRSYFILDRIEQASLHAIIVTLCVVIDPGFSHKKGVGTLGFAAIFLFNVRFIVLALWGVCGDKMPAFMIAWFRRINCLAPDELVVSRDALILRRKHGYSERLLQDIVNMCATMEMERGRTSKFRYTPIVALMQRVAITAYVERLIKNDRAAHSSIKDRFRTGLQGYLYENVSFVKSLVDAVDERARAAKGQVVAETVPPELDRIQSSLDEHAASLRNLSSLPGHAISSRGSFTTTVEELHHAAMHLMMLEEVGDDSGIFSQFWTENMQGAVPVTPDGKSETLAQMIFGGLSLSDDLVQSNETGPLALGAESGTMSCVTSCDAYVLRVESGRLGPVSPREASHQEEVKASCYKDACTSPMSLSRAPPSEASLQEACSVNAIGRLQLCVDISTSDLASLRELEDLVSKLTQELESMKSKLVHVEDGRKELQDTVWKRTMELEYTENLVSKLTQELESTKSKLVHVEDGCKELQDTVWKRTMELDRTKVALLRATGTIPTLEQTCKLGCLSECPKTAYV